MGDVSVKIDAKKATDRLGIIQKRLLDFRPAFEAIAQDFAVSQGTMFKKRGAISGFQRWADLRPSTLAKKKGRAKTKILQDTGRLMGSLTNVKDPEFVAIYNKKSISLGTSVPYAKWHHKGTSQMPKRSLLRYTKAREKKWGSLIVRHIVSSRGLKFERLK
tara:strand:+ start:2739 stop:3221 length:483 start_codon:yes stop_codon:yes gene_type:complete